MDALERLGNQLMITPKLLQTWDSNSRVPDFKPEPLATGLDCIGK